MILFDGVCNLCNAFVRFVIARDPAGRFQFGALQSPAARRLLDAIDSGGLWPDGIVLVEDGRALDPVGGGAADCAAAALPWPLAHAFVAVPRPLRDWIYSVVARRRYRWFGRQAVCMVPTPALAARFIEGTSAGTQSPR